MRRFCPILIVLLVPLLVVSGGSASGQNALPGCKSVAKLGGLHDRAVVIRSNCVFQISAMEIRGAGNLAIPTSFAWSASGRGGDCVSLGSKTGGRIRCTGLRDLNSRRRWVWVGIRARKDRCALKLAVVLSGDTRCKPNVSCAGMSFSERNQPLRIRGC